MMQGLGVGLFDKKKKGQTTHDCDTCGLYKSVRSPKIKCTGKGRQKIFVLAEAPGEQEDIEGKQLVGDAGKLLREKLGRMQLDLDRDFWKDNALGCRPPNNRDPSLLEMKCCRQRWQKAMAQANPKMVWLMGQKALDAYFLDMVDVGTIGSWRRHCIPDYQNNCWVVPMYHPSFLLYNRDGIAENVFEKDLRWAMACCLNKLPPKPAPVIELLYSKDDILSILRWINEFTPPLVFDYETSGLKPYRNGHVVHCISICDIHGECSYSFPVSYPDYFNAEEQRQIVEHWRSILLNEKVAKIAHNIKFEDKWSYNVFGVRPVGWHWCTMNGEHLLDTRSGLTGLKNVAFLRWGVEHWGKELEKYMKEDDEGFNTIHLAPLEKLLTYCSFDGWYEAKLYLTQQHQFNQQPGLLRCYEELYHPGLIALSESEDIGICIDVPYYNKEKEFIDGETVRIQKELDTSEEAVKFKKRTSRDIKFSSNKDLNTLFFDVMEINPLRKTKTGGAVDEKSLAKFNLPIAQKIVAQRKLKKNSDTYIKSYLTSQFNGRIHPSFNLHIATSGRSSSSDPNFQNVPKRDKVAMKLVRKGIIPSPGNVLLMADYAGAEVRTMPCYSFDEVLIKYVTDPTTDMHRDQAMNIFMLRQEEITKDIRQIGKNAFVFPQFYGDWYKACAEYIWESAEGKKTASGIDLMEHLRSQGYSTLTQFEEHIKDVEHEFWELLSATTKWKERIVQDYLRKGYVELHTGFRRTGYLDRKQIVNTPIQGTAFHMLLWSYIRMHEILHSSRMKSRLIGQIHDEMVLDVAVDEIKVVAGLVRDVTCNQIKEWAPWLIVPMDVDIEVSAVGGNWAEKYEIT